MGMYTQLVMGASLTNEKYQEIKPILDYMLENKPGDKKPDTPTHPLFNTPRWYFMLHGDSHYFDMKSSSKITTYDYTDTVHLTIVCNIKNYDDEIAKFLDWISPYLDNEVGEFLGFTRYEEDAHPALIYHRQPPFYVLDYHLRMD